VLYQGLSNVPAERAQVTYPFVWWDGVFSDEEINRMAAYFQEAGEGNMQPGKRHGGKLDLDVRRCSVVHFLWDQTNAWIFDKLNDAILHINSRWYGFDLNGYKAIQYAEYHAEDSDHHDWHLDLNLGADVGDQTQPRKLSLAMLLNTPGEDFEGGEFHVCQGNPEKPQVCPSQKGRIIAFPSWMIHRVTPVTAGVRRSLVTWVTGPKFT
jgi:predicted 2-oxoglutarate/Fe(II)-dependent dioxygenase YbiX